MSDSKLAILWFLCGTKNKASSRLHGYCIHQEFIKLNINSYIIYSPVLYDEKDFPNFIKPFIRVDLRRTISIIQKLDGINTDKLIDWLKKSGSYVVYVGCDLRYEHKSWTRAQMLLATSSLLCNYYSSQSNKPVFLIKEPYEFSCAPSVLNDIRNTNKFMRVVWFGNKDNWGSLLPWKNIIESDFSEMVELLTCSDHPDADIKWSSNNLKILLTKANLCILPTSDSVLFSVKSSNRLVQCMAMGLPCVTGPLKSYIEIHDIGLPVFVARSDDDFRAILKRLLLNKSYLNELCTSCYDGVINRYSPETVARQWLEILDIKISNNKDILKLVNFGRKVLILRGALFVFRIINNIYKLIINVPIKIARKVHIVLKHKIYS